MTTAKQSTTDSSSGGPTNWDQNNVKLLMKALAFAADKHRDQRRKNQDASPYINHPIDLANILCNEGRVDDIEVICAALLHDTVEDTETTFEDIESEFGKPIQQIVKDVTDDKSLNKAVRKQKQIEHAAHVSDKAKLVKLADKISNLRDIANDPPTGWSLERRQEYFDWAKDVIDQLRGVSPRIESLFDDEYTRRPQ